MSRPTPRILIVASLAESLINFRGPLIQALLEQGAEVHVAAPAINTALRARFHALGVQAHEVFMARTGTRPLQDLRSYLALRRLIQQIQPDIFLGYTIKPVVYGLTAAASQRVPKKAALITGLGHAFMASSHGLVAKIASALYRHALHSADVIFFQNLDDRQLFLERGLFPASTRNRVVNGSGVDLDFYAAAPLPTGKPVFLMIARLLGDKGVREYAAAARQVKKTHPEAEFHLAGRIDSNPNAIRQAELDQWVSEGSIHFLGQLKDVRPALQACTVYVLPSYREGTPRTVLEAMATGRPIITTDAPGCRETVIPGQNGYLVPVQAAADLAQAMRAMLDNPQNLPAMGYASRRMAEEKYDVKKVNQAMLELLLP